jgi:hypothetical protein
MAARGGLRGEPAILAALAELAAVGMGTPGRKVVAFLSGYVSAKQAGFLKAVVGLKKKGYVLYSSPQTLALTSSGLEQAPSGLDPPRSNDDIHDRIVRMLQPKPRIMFKLLSDGNVHTRLEVARAMGYPNDTVRVDGLSTDARFVGPAHSNRPCCLLLLNSSHLRRLGLRRCSTR